MLNFTDFLYEEDGGRRHEDAAATAAHDDDRYNDDSRADRGRRESPSFALAAPYMPVTATVSAASSSPASSSSLSSSAPAVAAQFDALRRGLAGMEHRISSAEASMDNIAGILAADAGFRRLHDNTRVAKQQKQQQARMGGGATGHPQRAAAVAAAAGGHEYRNYDDDSGGGGGGEGDGFDNDEGPLREVELSNQSSGFDPATQQHWLADSPASASAIAAAAAAASSSSSSFAANGDPQRPFGGGAASGASSAAGSIAGRRGDHGDNGARDSSSRVVREVVARLAALREQQASVRIQQNRARRAVARIRQNLPALLHHLMRLAEDLMASNTGVRLFHLRAALQALPARHIQHRDSVAIDMARYYAQKLAADHAVLHRRLMVLMDSRRRGLAGGGGGGGGGGGAGSGGAVAGGGGDSDGGGGGEFVPAELEKLITAAQDAWVDWEFDLERAVVVAAEYACVDQQRQDPLGHIDKRVIAEVRSFKKPTPQLVRIVHATLLVLGFPVREHSGGGGGGGGGSDVAVHFGVSKGARRARPPLLPDWKECCAHFNFRNQREILRRMRAFAAGDVPAEHAPRARRVLRRLFSSVDGETAQHSNRHAGALYRWLRGVHVLLTSAEDLQHTARVFGVLYPAVVRVRLPRGRGGGKSSPRGSGGPVGPSVLPRAVLRRLPGVYRLVPDVLYHNQVVYRREARFDDRSATEVSLCFAEAPFGRWGFRLGGLRDDGGGGGAAARDNGRGSRVLPLRSVGAGHVWPLGVRWQVLKDDAAAANDSNAAAAAWEDLDAPVCEMFHDPV